MCRAYNEKWKKKQIMDGIEQPNQERIRMLGEKKSTSTWEYWKWTPSNKWR